MFPDQQRAARWSLIVLCILIARPAEAGKLLDRILKILGVTATPSQMKGEDDEPAGGQIWVSDLASGPPRALTTDGGYRWPIFTSDGSQVLALQDLRLVTISVASGIKTADSPARGVAKLVGADSEKAEQVLVLRQQRATPALLSLKKGTLTDLPFDRSETPLVAYLRGEQRVYGLLRLLVSNESELAGVGTRTWHEIQLQRTGENPVPISACKPSSCRQPSLSPDGRRAVYILVGTGS